MSPQELPPEQNSTVDHNTLLYQAENDAAKAVQIAEQDVQSADQQFGYGEYEVAEESEAAFLAEEASDRLIEAQQDHDATVANSNVFAAGNMDALHEAAINEAAQRVADVYESTEPDH